MTPTEKPDYTWQQSLRYFVLGLSYTLVYAMWPIAVVLWHNYQNYSDPVDWKLVAKMIVAACGPVIYSYWREKRALLKLPAWFVIPPEFQLVKTDKGATIALRDAGTE